MGRKLINDFISQKKNLTGMFLVAIPAAIIGFAFQAIYICLALILTATTIIVYLNTFFDYGNGPNDTQKSDLAKEDVLIQIMVKKNEVRTKYVEILILVFVMYVVMYIAYTADALDSSSFDDPEFSIFENLGKITLYPMTIMLVTSIFTPFLFRIKISKTLFMSLAIVSMVILYGIFLLDHFFSFAEKENVMMILPYPVIATCIISYFVAMKIVIRKND